MITVEEDKKLLRDTMPDGDSDYLSPEYHLARYVAAQLHLELERRPPEGWFR